MEIVGGQDRNTHSTKRRLSGAPDTKLYWYDAAGQVLAETDSRGNAVDNYVYFNGVSIAKLHIEPGPTYYSYYVRDHLGTTRMITDQAGNVCYDADYFPWGGEQHIYVNGCPQSYKFSGKERDPDTGSDYFGARFYQGAMARFYSPDWSAVPEAVPYADLSDPQTLNLYSYVRNNPLAKADADGHCPSTDHPCPTLSKEDKAQNKPQVDSKGNPTFNPKPPGTPKWTYKQSTGSTDLKVDAITVQHAGTGYAGHGQGLNDPESQSVGRADDKANAGPLPQGQYTIGNQQTNTTSEGKELPASMRLTPSANNEMFGRAGFLIHGGYASGAQTASEGCIVLTRPERNAVGGSGVNTLDVEP